MATFRRVLGGIVLGGCMVACGQAPGGPPSGAPAMSPEQRQQMRAAMSQPQAAPKDDPAFQAIFDGKTMTGWEGGPNWRVENGTLVGETTTANPLKQNTFVIWRVGDTKDFELKLEYRLSAQGNSGIQYRSTAIPNREFALRGYQADIDAENRYTGQVYEEQGRGFLALRGQATRIEAGEPVAKRIVGTLGDATQLQSLIRKEDWNEVHIIARGSTIVQLINGQVMSVLVDDDPKGRRADGILGLQLHVGPPMKIEYRNIRLKRL